MRSFRLAGPVVGYLVEDGDRYEAETHLTVVRLDSGERWSSDPENRQIGSLTGFTEIAVDRLANAAWIRKGYDGSGHRIWRLFVRRAGTVSLRHRSRHELTRLRLGSLRVRWTQRGKRHKRSL